MADKSITPFEDIESAYEYLTLLGEAVLESRVSVRADIDLQPENSGPRRIEALRLVLYKLQKLQEHLKTSRRLLNDLRSLRRLLQDERHLRSSTIDTACKGSEPQYRTRAEEFDSGSIPDFSAAP